MLTSTVRSLTTKQQLIYWITERESIRLKKDLKRPKPWTDDGILQSYRFCNVRRMDDRVSKWLLENWYKPYFNHPNMLAAVALARFINLPDTLKNIQAYVFCSPVPDWEKIKNIVRNIKADGYTVFNGAYIVPSALGTVDKIEAVVDRFVKPLSNQVQGFTGDRMQEAWQWLLQCEGFGSFLAGQVVADLRWSMKGEWADRNSWAPIGPGSKRGINRYHRLPINAPMLQRSFERELKDLIEEIKPSIEYLISHRMEAMDYQNCMCEYDKYLRTLYNEGRAKQRYPGI